MNEILSSATKIVLLYLIGILGLLTAISLFVNQEAFKILLDVFKTVILMVVSFYFGQKTNVPVETPLP